jgi:long-chain acyl-CoA synthetase
MLVNEFLEQTAVRTPDKEALIFQQQRLTYLELDNFANRLGNALIELGLQKLDRVAIYLDNSIEAVVSIFGILKAGGVFVLINPQTKPRKLEYILSDCQVRFLITDSKLGLNYQANHADLQVISIDQPQDVENIKNIENSANHYFWDLIDRSSSTQPPIISIDIDLCSLIYTSGSTGKPKGVMLSHLNMVAAANSIITYLENTCHLNLAVLLSSKNHLSIHSN